MSVHTQFAKLGTNLSLYGDNAATLRLLIRQWRIVYALLSLTVCRSCLSNPQQMLYNCWKENSTSKGWFNPTWKSHSQKLPFSLESYSKLKLCSYQVWTIWNQLTTTPFVRQNAGFFLPSRKGTQRPGLYIISSCDKCDSWHGIKHEVTPIVYYLNFIIFFTVMNGFSIVTAQKNLLFAPISAPLNGDSHAEKLHGEEFLFQARIPQITTSKECELLCYP